MKIFLNLVSIKTGGQITRAINFIEYVQIIDPEIKVYIIKQSNILNELKESSNIHIRNVDFGRKFIIIKRLIWENMFLNYLIKKSNSDIFLTFSHYLPISKISIPTIVGVSNLAPFSKIALSEESFYYKLKFWILSITIKNSIKKADIVLALSTTGKEIIEKLGINKHKILLNHIGIDTFWYSTNSLNKSENSNKFILYVSHFYRYKNHIRLIEAYSILPEYIKNNFDLILIGKPVNISYYNNINTLINSLDLTKNVKIIPGLDRTELLNYYKNTSLFIFPSLVENCPNILLEAMACGAPICSNEINPMKEYCKENAIYFDGLSPKSISDSIKHFLNHDLSKSMSDKSIERSKDFSWYNFTKTLIETMKKTTKKNVRI